MLRAARNGQADHREKRAEREPTARAGDHDSGHDDRCRHLLESGTEREHRQVCRLVALAGERIGQTPAAGGLKELAGGERDHSQGQHRDCGRGRQGRHDGEDRAADGGSESAAAHASRSARNRVGSATGSHLKEHREHRVDDQQRRDDGLRRV